MQSAGDFLGLAGRTAMVWGGGAGMGRAVAERFAALSCNVAVVDVNAAAAETTAGDLRAQGVRTLGLTCDVRREVDVAAAVAAAEGELGCPTLSVNVVGVATARPILEMTGPQWEDELRLNLSPAFFIGREVARAMIKAKLGGAIAFVGSVAGMVGFPHGLAGYGAAKAGLHGLVKTMAMEWGPHGIRVNCIAPGVVNTVRIPATAESRERMKTKLPIGRAAEVGEMADALVYLVSERASYVNGATVNTDGGYMIVPAVGAG